MHIKKFTLLIAFMPLFSFAQEADAVMSKFFAVQVDEVVFMRWTIIRGNSCEDTYIERSADGISYEEIGLIGGICGSPDESATYEFTDSLPLVNRTSYYRLLLGYYGYTSPKVVEFMRYNDHGFILAPNPFIDFTRLSFENDDEEKHQLIITDMQGRIVQEMATTGDEFIIQRTDMNSGIYFFSVSSPRGNIFSGKLTAY